MPTPDPPGQHRLARAAHLAAPDVKVVDATWFLPTMRRDARAEYAAAHIPGAVFFDIDDIADEASPLPHMLPDAAKFSSRMRRLGLGDGTRIVRLRQQPLLGERARLVDVPPVRPSGRGGAGRRAGQVAGRGPAGRPISRCCRARRISPRARTICWCAIWSRCAPIWSSRREQVVDARSARALRRHRARAARRAARRPHPAAA